MEKINRNNFMDKIIFLIRARILDEIDIEENKDIMVKKISKICNDILSKEK